MSIWFNRFQIAFLYIVLALAVLGSVISFYNVMVLSCANIFYNEYEYLSIDNVLVLCEESQVSKCVYNSSGFIGELHRKFKNGTIDDTKFSSIDFSDERLMYNLLIGLILTAISFCVDHLLKQAEIDMNKKKEETAEKKVVNDEYIKLDENLSSSV